MVKDSQLQIRVSAAQKKRIKEMAQAAGMDLSSWILALAFPAAKTCFRELLEMLTQPGGHEYALAELNTFLARLNRDEFEDVTRESPLLPEDVFLQNYVAAMVEFTARRCGAQPPPWTASIPALRDPVFASSLTSLRPHLLRSSPPPFRRRNIFIDSSVGAQV